MDQYITFDDVLIKPKFSFLNSRKDVNLSLPLFDNLHLDLPVISANMSTITGTKMASTMSSLGGVGALHRFWSIEDNVNALVKVLQHDAENVIVSIGVGDQEKERAEALHDVGALWFCIDVAHGAQRSVVEQTNWLLSKYRDIRLIVGNFATAKSIKDFKSFLKGENKPDLYKVGIGPGSVCTTRLKTGCGVPQLSAILDCAREYPIIADGGMRTPGDIAKALAAGAKAVMLGGMLAGTDESEAAQEVFKKQEAHPETSYFKAYFQYKGSASEGYGNGWKTSEGISTMVHSKGPLEHVIRDIEGGLRSALTYTGSQNLTEFQRNAEFIKVSGNTIRENKAHIDEAQ